MPLPALERELLALGDGIAANDEAARLLPGLRLPDEARDLAPLTLARRLPVARGDLRDPRPHGRDQGRPDRVGDPTAFEIGEEVLAEEALVGARLGDEAEERVPGDLAGVGAARALAGADRAVVLDKRRVEVERRLPTLDERVDAGKQLVEGPVELADMAEVEARKEAPQRGGTGDRVAVNRPGFLGGSFICRAGFLRARPARPTVALAGRARAARRAAPRFLW